MLNRRFEEWNGMHIEYEPRSEKTGLQGFRPGLT